MSKQYHYLVAGLPDILFDDNKTPVTLGEFYESLKEVISGADLEILKLFFYRYDNGNLTARLKNAEAPINELGNLTAEELDELIQLVKEGSINDINKSTPAYLIDFIEAYFNEEPINANKSWELQLTELYYKHVTQNENEFANKFFQFESDALNLGTAIQCRKNNVEVPIHLIGNSEVTNKLAKSTTRDFGLSDEIEMLDQLLKVYDEDNLLEREKKLDLITWSYLDEKSFFHYFTIERIFSFVVKLSVVERWMGLDKETGKELFNELIKSLENSYEIPVEL